VQRTFPEVLERVVALFRGHDDLIHGFVYFLPDVVQV
jgi:histone deacetylase complex regulatory component SIN3